MTIENATFSDALTAISKLQLSPEDGQRFVAVVTAAFGNGETVKASAVTAAATTSSEPVVTAKSRRPRGSNHGVQFKGHLAKLLKDSPKKCEDLIEPLRERGVILPMDQEACVEEIEAALRKSRQTYRVYPDGRWGRMSYPALRAVV